ncbi:hypothetical protein Trydic_g18523, partial [Trypoxylus dichotomus]
MRCQQRDESKNPGKNARHLHPKKHRNKTGSSLPNTYGKEEELPCPCIYVLWYRDTMQLDTTERRIMESRGSRHTLVIRKVHRSDFGNYTCVADNQLGKTRKSVQLTGKPNAAKFSSASRGQSRDSYNITWAVKSLSPIEEYKLLFRRLPDSPSSPEDGHPQPLHHQSQRKLPGK